MSEPYVYRPPNSYPSGYIPASYTPQGSPYIPQAALPGGSPYASPYSSPYRNSIPLPGSPNTRNRVLFPTTGYDTAGAYDAVYHQTRQRRPSWHAPTTPYLGAEDPYVRERRRSFGGGSPYGPAAHPPYPYAWAGGVYETHANNWPNYSASGSPYGRAPSPLPGLPSTPGQFHLHPWLNAEDWRGDFLFDLSSPRFNPLIVRSHETRPDGQLVVGQTEPAPMEMMMQTATVPGLRRLRIVCDVIPQWPIDISFDGERAQGLGNPGSVAFRPDPLANAGVPPITFNDVILCVHRALQSRISHMDWQRLTESEEIAVSRAYTQRCRAAAHVGTYAGAYGAEAEQSERAQGVKRIDFLLGKVWFKGSWVDWHEGVLRLVTM